MMIKKQEVMFKKYSIIILAILVLTTFSSCGFIKIDLIVAAEQFTDFSPKESPEDSIDCGCYGPKYKGMCNKMLAPVCGCDGVTYSNGCVARRYGIYIYTRGECGKPYPVNRPICPASPPEIYPSPGNPTIVNPLPTNYPEVWPANPRKPANDKLPPRGEATLVQTKEHKRK